MFDLKALIIPTSYLRLNYRLGKLVISENIIFCQESSETTIFVHNRKRHEQAWK